MKYKNEMIYLLFEDKIWGINLDIFNYFKSKDENLKNEYTEKENYYAKMEKEF